MNTPKTSPSFDQLDKNTVDARNQLHGAGPVRFLNPAGKGQKVLVIGNSMLLHGINEPLGWHNECGMAASKPENDYVHRLMGLMDDPRICICQVSAWERDYKTGQTQLERFREARDFGAQLIVMRAIENCPKQDFDGAVFQAQLEKLLAFLDPEGAARLVLTTGFWRHPGDEAIREFYQILAPSDEGAVSEADWGRDSTTPPPLRGTSPDKGRLGGRCGFGRPPSDWRGAAVTEG